MPRDRSPITKATALRVLPPAPTSVPPPNHACINQHNHNCSGKTQRCNPCAIKFRWMLCVRPLNHSLLQTPAHIYLLRSYNIHNMPLHRNTIPPIYCMYSEEINNWNNPAPTRLVPGSYPLKILLLRTASFKIRRYEWNKKNNRPGPQPAVRGPGINTFHEHQSLPWGKSQYALEWIAERGGGFFDLCSFKLSSMRATLRAITLRVVKWYFYWRKSIKNVMEMGLFSGCQLYFIVCQPTVIFSWPTLVYSQNWM